MESDSLAPDSAFMVKQIFGRADTKYRVISDIREHCKMSPITEPIMYGHAKEREESVIFSLYSVI